MIDAPRFAPAMEEREKKDNVNNFIAICSVKQRSHEEEAPLYKSARTEIKDADFFMVIIIFVHTFITRR